MRALGEIKPAQDGLAAVDDQLLALRQFDSDPDVGPIRLDLADSPLEVLMGGFGGRCGAAARTR